MLLGAKKDRLGSQETSKLYSESFVWASTAAASGCVAFINSTLPTLSPATGEKRRLEGDPFRRQFRWLPLTSGGWFGAGGGGSHGIVGIVVQCIFPL